MTYRACSKLLFDSQSAYEIAVLENVCSLHQKSDAMQQSDVEFIEQEFRMHGWSVITVDLEARDFGSAANRARTIFIGMRGNNKFVKDSMSQDCVFWFHSYARRARNVLEVVSDCSFARETACYFNTLQKNCVGAARCPLVVLGNL